MEADSPPKSSEGAIDQDENASPNQPSNHRRLSSENEPDSSFHPFNETRIENITVIENVTESSHNSEINKNVSCEGSDSGVEVIENNDNCVYQRTLSANSSHSRDCELLTPARSCDSSIISCCSNYDEAYNILVRRNSTLLEDYTLRNNDGCTSENGSESSSVTGSSTSRTTKRNQQLNSISNGKKKVSLADSSKNKAPLNKERSRTKPPVTPRLKSTDRSQNKNNPNQPSTKSSNSTLRKSAPNNLDINSSRRDLKRSSSVRTSSSTRTPVVTPTDDGRWPSINSKPAPLMSKSLRGVLETKPTRPLPAYTMDTKTIEKYATLPRRRKENTKESVKDIFKPNSRESSVNRLSVPKKINCREATPSKVLPSYIKKKQRTKIFHESSIQTAITMTDVEKALAGVAVYPTNPYDKETADKNIQVDMRLKDVEKLQEDLKQLNEKYDALTVDFKNQTEKLRETEQILSEERLEKRGLEDELKQTTQRVLAILGADSNPTEENVSSDSLLVLESRFHNVSQVVIHQEEEISHLNAQCRALHLELEKSISNQKSILQHQQDLEAENAELQDFLQAEKQTLQDALKETEVENKKINQILNQKEKELEDKQEECKHLVRLSEQRRQENLGIQARLCAIESKSRQLLVHQGSSASGAAVALSALISRLGGLVEELIQSYEISDQELEDIIFHNEAYSNSSSSPDATPERSRKDTTPSPKTKGSSFVSAVINAIKNAAAQTPFAGHKDGSKDGLCSENSSSNEMLDSETEPCLMMEHVLEDVVIPDGHSHNMISSGHSMLNSRLTHSESLKDLSQAILNRQISEQASLSYAGSLNTSFTSDVMTLSDVFPSISLVDQVIDVDNLITRLLKVIRIIQIENDDCMNELQDQRDSLSVQIDKQKDTNKSVIKQLKDWEVLGARLKTEAKELMQQLSRKNTEMDKIKTELNNQREQVEKLNQDVCELSTALAKAELEMKMKEEEVAEAIKNWEKKGEIPTPEVLGKLVVTQDEVHSLKEKLSEKEKCLSELTQEFLTSRQFLSVSLKKAVTEAKKQYDAIDNALEVLHSVQSIVQQCPQLAKLQSKLEQTSFESASVMPIVAPPDCNANAALLQAIASLEIPSPINTTA